MEPCSLWDPHNTAVAGKLAGLPAKEFFFLLSFFFFFFSRVVTTHVVLSLFQDQFKVATSVLTRFYTQSKYSP